MNTTYEQYESLLFLVSKRAFGEMLLAADAQGNWDLAMQTLKRHGVSDTIVAAPCTKLGWERVALPIDRSKLGDNAHMEEVCSFLSREWLKLLKRELSAGSVPVLARIDGQSLDLCMRTLYVNESTGDGVAYLLMSRVTDAIVENSAAVQSAFADLDRRMDTVARVIERNAERSAQEIAKRTDARFDELAEQTRRQFETVGQLQEARFDLALSETQRQPAPCAECKPSMCTPEFAMPRLKGPRTGHEQEDAWIYQQERDMAAAKRNCDCPGGLPTAPTGSA